MGVEAALGCVIGRFPHRESEIDDLYRSSQQFRSLCEDYYECLKSLSRWTRETSTVATVYQGDYRELLVDLETDIARYLDRLRVRT
jgi:hypothetical protein